MTIKCIFCKQRTAKYRSPYGQDPFCKKCVEEFKSKTLCTMCQRRFGKMYVNGWAYYCESCFLKSAKLAMDKTGGPY